MPVRSLTRSRARTWLPGTARFSVSRSTTRPEWHVSRISTCFWAGIFLSHSVNSVPATAVARRTSGSVRLGAAGVARQVVEVAVRSAGGDAVAGQVDDHHVARLGLLQRLQRLDEVGPRRLAVRGRSGRGQDGGVDLARAEQPVRRQPQAGGEVLGVLGGVPQVQAGAGVLGDAGHDGPQVRRFRVRRALGVEFAHHAPAGPQVALGVERLHLDDVLAAGVEPRVAAQVQHDFQGPGRRGRCRAAGRRRSPPCR